MVGVEVEMEVELLEVEREFLPSRRSLPMRSSMAFGVASGGGGGQWAFWVFGAKGEEERGGYEEEGEGGERGG